MSSWEGKSRTSLVLRNPTHLVGVDGTDEAQCGCRPTTYRESRLERTGTDDRETTIEIWF